MNVILDTHAALWLLAEPERLGDAARRTIREPANSVLLSAAVVWEIALKSSLGKLEVGEEYVDVLADAGVRTLAVTARHAAAVRRLPSHHRDPFDRMLVSQAQVEAAVLVTRDPAFAGYDVDVVW